MRVLLLSTYELGHQPLGIAGPAAILAGAGHETRGVDLAQTDLPAEDAGWAQAAAISVPMHTAARLALEVVARLRRVRNDLPLAFHGLYAPTVALSGLVGPGDLLVAGDPSDALLEWLAGLASPPASARRTGPGERVAGSDGPVAGGRGRFPGGDTPPSSVRIDLGPAHPAAAAPPLRQNLPPLEVYAQLARGSARTAAASVAASHGCNHKCRHCPVAPVYGGRSRPVAIETVMADVDQVVEMGAGHVSFADPDFLNRPQHAVEVARRLHERHPAVSYDATVKIEHILRHATIWPELSAAGLAFVTSAFESTDDHVLQLLEKGHSAADEGVAVGIVRRAGIDIRPSWLPFTPWTTSESLSGLLDFAARADLAWSTDAVQYSIRLLLPAGSLLLDHPDPVLEAAIGRAAQEPPALSTAWCSARRELDELQVAFAARAEMGTARGEAPDETFAAIWRLGLEGGLALALDPPLPSAAAATAAGIAGPDRPRLTEGWFCCAEPTAAQMTRIASPA
ncbi:MAG: radical SAM protein [Acidimicrobiales bacterium]